MHFKPAVQYRRRKHQVHHYLVEDIDTHAETLYLLDCILHTVRHRALTQDNQQIEADDIGTNGSDKDNQRIRQRQWIPDEDKQYKDGERQDDVRPIGQEPGYTKLGTDVANHECWKVIHYLVNAKEVAAIYVL